MFYTKHSIIGPMTSYSIKIIHLYDRQECSYLNFWFIQQCTQCKYKLYVWCKTFSINTWVILVRRKFYEFASFLDTVFSFEYYLQFFTDKWKSALWRRILGILNSKLEFLLQSIELNRHRQRLELAVSTHRRPSNMREHSFMKKILPKNFNGM